MKVLGFSTMSWMVSLACQRFDQTLLVRFLHLRLALSLIDEVGEVARKYTFQERQSYINGCGIKIHGRIEYGFGESAILSIAALRPVATVSTNLNLIDNLVDEGV